MKWFLTLFSLVLCFHLFTGEKDLKEEVKKSLALLQSDQAKHANSSAKENVAMLCIKDKKTRIILGTLAVIGTGCFLNAIPKDLKGTGKEGLDHRIFAAAIDTILAYFCGYVAYDHLLKKEIKRIT